MSEAGQRWDEVLSAYRAGEPVELVDGGRTVGRLLPKNNQPPKWDPENPNAIWDEFRKLRDSLPKTGVPMALRDLRELRES